MTPEEALERVLKRDGYSESLCERARSALRVGGVEHAARWAYNEGYMSIWSALEAVRIWGKAL